MDKRETAEESIRFETKWLTLSQGNHLLNVLKGIIPWVIKEKLYQVELNRQGRHYLKLLQ